jgi:hypothetical protein
MVFSVYLVCLVMPRRGRDSGVGLKKGLRESGLGLNTQDQEIEKRIRGFHKSPLRLKSRSRMPDSESPILPAVEVFEAGDFDRL